MPIEVEKLKTINYFQGLEPAELEYIRQFMFEKTVEKGKIFLAYGDQTDCLYFVVSGLVRVYKLSSSGKEQTLHIAPPGDSLNDVATFAGGASEVNMVAMTNVVLYGIRKQDLWKILHNPPRITMNIIRELAIRVRRDSRLVEELSSGQALSRLAKLLLGEYAGEEATRGLHLTQEDMASMIGTSRELVNRSLRILEENGAIILKRHHVVVLDKEILSRYTGIAEETRQKEP